MEMDEIKNKIDLYEEVFIFFKHPRKIIEFAIKNKGARFIKELLTFFIINSIIFIFIINHLNSEKYVTKWIPFIIFIQCLFSIPLCIIDSTFREKKEVKTYIKVGITEALMVLSPLLYFNTILYFLFLISETYFFYYFYVLFSGFITLYISFYFSIKIVQKRKIISAITTLISCVILNFLTMITVANLSTGYRGFYIVDVIYQESIKTVPQIIEYEGYFLDHQVLINELAESLFTDENKDNLKMINEQIDLIIKKGKDISFFGEKIIFNRNKKELLILKEITDAYERIKREIFVYEFIPKIYINDLQKLKNENAILIERSKKIKQVKNDDDKVAEYIDELKQIKSEMIDIQNKINNFSQYQCQLKINNKALEEIRKNFEIINIKQKELNEQIDKKINYWKQKSHFFVW